MVEPASFPCKSAQKGYVRGGGGCVAEAVASPSAAERLERPAGTRTVPTPSWMPTVTRRPPTRSVAMPVTARRGRAVEVVSGTAAE